MAAIAKGSLPYRYAKALISLAEEAGAIEKVAEELSGLKTAIGQIAKLATYLSDVIVPRSERHQVLVQLLDQLAVSDVTRRFALFLLSRERFAWLEAIITAYARLCDERSGIVRAKVVSSAPLSAEQARRVEKILSEKTGKQVAVEYAEDASLLGGMLIRLGSRVYDGSVRGDLKRAQEMMLKRVE